MRATCTIAGNVSRNKQAHSVPNSFARPDDVCFCYSSSRQMLFNNRSDEND
jgi:hypothetical protein